MGKNMTGLATLQLTVRYDPSVTDAESLASAADKLMETGLSATGPLDEYGNPTFSEFSVAIESED